MNISLSDELEVRVRDLAAARGEAPETLVEAALVRLLDDEADRAKIASRMARFEENGQAFEHANVLAKLRQRAGVKPDT